MISYPRITVSRYATPRTEVDVVESNATTLLAPFISEKGPNGVIQKIYSEGQFISEYGDPDYTKQGQTILNIYNWLNAGGTVLAYRLVDEDAKTATVSASIANVAVTITAKYPGTYYNKYTVELTQSKQTGYINVVVKYDSYLVKTYVVSADTISSLKDTAYFSTFTVEDFATLRAGLSLTVAEVITLSTGTDLAFDSAEDVTLQDGLIDNYYQAVIANEDDYLRNNLLLPVDVILDAGYSETLKETLQDFSLIRPDITIFLDNYTIVGDVPTVIDVVDSSFVSLTQENIALYGQYCTVDNPITTATTSATVTPTYFLASLIPSNDKIYGIQWPTAGLTRGILSKVKSVYPALSPSQKEIYYDKRVNYVEKDSRGYFFMSQLTSSEESTALSYVNNIRVINRIERDIELLGRRFLFEFNDATTLKEMKSQLDIYITEWIQNRTLNYAEVTVSADDLYDNIVNVGLEIKFTGTIEVISIDIVIE